MINEIIEIGIGMMFIIMSVAILSVETVVPKKDKKNQKTNKTWIRMRIRDYLNGLMNVIEQLGDAVWDDVGKYTVSKQTKDLKVSTSYWFNAIAVLNAMRVQWSALMTLNAWVDSTSKSVLSDIDAMVIQLNERCMTAKDLKAHMDSKSDIDEQIAALMAKKAALETGVETPKETGGSLN